ncbi:MAG: alpha/beta fold hydrolase [Actinomycetia bacterium]|nr:alpha/beta fold hydrolase [Actinomycetes bacterium]
MDLQWQQGTVSRDGEDIYWELTQSSDDDDRPVVVLSHGAGGHHGIWYLQVPVLGQHFRVVTWDSRGFGNSTNRNDAPSAPAAAADLAAVLDHLGIQGAHHVGQSMGGWHIAAFAVAHPSRVQSLVFADTIGALWTDELRAAVAALRAEIGSQDMRHELIGGHRALWPGTAERDPAHAFLYQALGSLHQPPMAKLADTINWALGHEEITAIGVPVLFVAGSHDRVFPAALLRASSQLIPGARFIEIAGAGHSPYFEQPSVWNDAVLSFLQAV